MVISPNATLPSEYTTPAHAEYVYGPGYGPGPGHGPGGRPAIGFADVIQILRRGWRSLLLGCLLGLLVGIGYILVVKTPYKATARILLDGSMNRYLQTNKIIDQPTPDDKEIASQIYILSSDSVVVPVVRSLNLVGDSEFVNPDAARTAVHAVRTRLIGLWDNVANAVNAALNMVRASEFGGEQKLGEAQAVEAGTGARGETDAVVERTAVEALLKRLTVFREDVANVINVTVESENPNKAAEIANAMADTYISNSLETKLKTGKLVNQWLQDQLMGLKRQAADADQALQDYKKANNLSTDGMGAQNGQVLANLKIQLMNARLAASEAKERLDRVRGASGEGIAATIETEGLVSTSKNSSANFALNDSNLGKLRERYWDLEAKTQEIEAIVGPTHVAAMKFRRKLDALGAKIKNEEQRVSDAYANEYQIAKVRESEIAASAARLSGETETGSQVRELENASETLHSLYNGFLQKYKEINAVQNDTLPVQTAHIITRAVPPLYRSPKKAIAVFGGSLMLGLFFGAAAAVGREWFADVFRTPKAVGQVTEIECVALPLVERKSAPIEEHILVAPYSHFAEGLRNIKASIDFVPSQEGGKVISVVSSAPNEGKTVIAANLAALMIISSGARTLLIDSDLHMRRLTHRLAPEAREGLIEALDNPSRLAELVVKRQRSGLDILPCVSGSRIPNAAELLGSAKMERLLAAARKSYDYIIIEIAPIMSVVDVKMIERFIDGFVFVVEWGRTKRTLVVDAMSYAQVIRDRLIAVVLNKINPVTFRSIESYKGARAGDYYQE